MNEKKNIEQNIIPHGNTCENAMRQKLERYRETNELFTNKWKGELKFIICELNKIYGGENDE